MKTVSKLIIAGLALSFASIVSAKRGAPPEALEACSGKAVADACEMTTPRGDAIGQCVATPDEQIACLPEGKTQGGGGKRPPRGGANESS